MRYHLFALVGISLAMIGLITNTGCKDPTSEVASNETETAGEMARGDHDHSDHDASDHAHEGEDVSITAEDVERPANYTDALARIAAYRDTIRQACGDGKPSAAHRSLDELTFVLEWLPGIARDSGIDKSYWETINVGAQTLRERFDELHTQIDAGESVDYGAIAADVDSTIEVISSVSTAAAEPAGNDSQVDTDS
jgi:hypothetical protein